MSKAIFFALALIASPAAAQQWIGEADYPPQALEHRQEGTVQVQLTFDAQGRVMRCDILRSSGAALLDATTCRLLYRRARANAGEPRARTYEHSWRLPARP